MQPQSKTPKFPSPAFGAHEPSRAPKTNSIKSPLGGNENGWGDWWVRGKGKRWGEGTSDKASSQMPTIHRCTLTLLKRRGERLDRLQ